MKHLRPGTKIRFLPGTPETGIVMTYAGPGQCGYEATAANAGGVYGLANFREFEVIPTVYIPTLKHPNHFRTGIIDCSKSELDRAIADSWALRRGEL